MLAYGLEVMIGGMVKLFAFVTIPFVFGVLPQAWAILLSSSLLRLLSGGAHCTAYYRCLTGSLCVYLLLSLSVKTISPYMPVKAALLGEGFVVLPLLMVYAPAKNPQRPLKSTVHRNILKAGACVLVLAQVFVLQRLAVPADIAVASIAGILFQAFTISPPGYQFIDWLDRVLTFNKSVKEVVK